MKLFIKLVLAIVMGAHVPNLFAYDEHHNRADLIVFSYDRPMQLYALLESVERHVTGIGQIVVIWRSSGASYESAYSVLHEEFPAVKFVMQDKKSAEEDFKFLLLTAFCTTPSEYVLFAVDDIIVTDFIDLSECTHALQQSNAYAFYLRMGKNITYNYNRDCNLRAPTLVEVLPGIYSWAFTLPYYDAWHYPNTVDCAVYKKSMILRDLQKISYKNPNTFENLWHRNARFIKRKCGLCYEHSKIVNIPLNQVQTVFACNKHMDNFSTEKLLDLFNQGLKIDTNALFQYKNKSVHITYEPVFIQRKRRGLSR